MLIAVVILTWLLLGIALWAVLFVGNMLDAVNCEYFDHRRVVAGYLWLMVMWLAMWVFFTIPVAIDKLWGAKRHWHEWPYRFWQRLNGKPLEEVKQ